MSSVDATLGRNDTAQEKIKDKKAFKQFLEHCCVCHHYFFSIKKCGTHDCELCGKPTIPAEDLKDIHHFPDPMKSQDHYKPFAEVWGTETSEKDRPSLLQQQKSRQCTTADTDKNTLSIMSTTVRDIISYSDRGKPH